MNDQQLISPRSVAPESHLKVTRIKEMITNQMHPWLFITNFFVILQISPTF